MPKPLITITTNAKEVAESLRKKLRRLAEKRSREFDRKAELARRIAGI